MHELMDAQWQLDHLRDEEDLRTVIQPLENLLIGFKRIIMKDTAVNAIVRSLANCENVYVAHRLSLDVRSQDHDSWPPPLRCVETIRVC